MPILLTLKVKTLLYETQKFGFASIFLSSYIAIDTLMCFIVMTSSIKSPKCLDWFMFINNGKNILAINTLQEVYTHSTMKVQWKFGSYS